MTDLPFPLSLTSPGAAPRHAAPGACHRGRGVNGGALRVPPTLTGPARPYSSSARGREIGSVPRAVPDGRGGGRPAPGWAGAGRPGLRPRYDLKILPCLLFSLGFFPDFCREILTVFHSK